MAGLDVPGTTYIARATPTLPRTNALIVQGMRDTLFDLNEGLANYQCLKAMGGDVRLVTTQAGHNVLGAIPDALPVSATGAANYRCGSLDITTATLAFFDEYLKGTTGATSQVVPAGPCLSLASGDAVVVDSVTTGRAGRLATVPTTALTAGASAVPVAIDLGVVAAVDDVLGGRAPPGAGGHQAHAADAGGPGAAGRPWSAARNCAGGLRADRQPAGAREGDRRLTVDMAGVGARLAAVRNSTSWFMARAPNTCAIGTTLGYTLPAIPVTVSGKAWLPMLGRLTNAAVSS